MPHLTADERDRIAELKAAGYNASEIAKRLKRHHSVVARELRRNAGDDKVYRACRAQRLCEARRRARPLVRKMERPKLNAAVRRGLARDFSPDQIARRLQREAADDPRMQVSAASVYRWIKASDDGRDFQSHLRRGGKRPRKKRENKPESRAAKIKDRPAEIENRERQGDLEGDTVLGKPGTGGMVTLVDRVSRYTIAFKIENKRAATVKRRIRQELLNQCGEDLHSLTFDNGTEFAQMPALGERMKLDVYYADPGKPYQRGTNENTNRLFRQYFPKGIDFETVSHQAVREKVELVNNRPRKCLGYRTPREVKLGIDEPLLRI